jgi:alpha-1,3-mannosyltransferase
MTYWRRGTRLGGRSPAFAFFRSHVIAFCFLAFTASVASFSSYYLGFFSTLQIYLPVAIFCIPALAVLDALDFSNRAHWPQIRKLRFGLAVCWCLYILSAPRYPSSGPSSYLNPHTKLSRIPGNQTYFIAANLYNSATILPSWTRELGLLVDFLGPLNVYISIYESNSHDQTKSMLRAFEMELKRRKAGNIIVLEDTEGRRPNWSLNGHERIRYMAGVRNKALEPLQRMQGLHGGTFDKLIFLNDIYFDWSVSHAIISSFGNS